MTTKKLLLEAACNGDNTAIETLLKEGADINAKDNDGNTALILAASRCHYETVQLLTKAGCDVNAKNNDGNNAIDLAHEGIYIMTAQVLKYKGATQERLRVAPFDDEEDAKRFFPEYTTMVPEEYAARFFHTIGAFSFHWYSYKDDVFDEWIQGVADIILNKRDKIDEYRKKFFTEEEIARLDKEAMEGW